MEPYISPASWVDGAPDCLVVCCSDHRFERHIRSLVEHLGFRRPHVLQFPSGAALSLPLVSAFNFISKAVDKIIERVVEIKHVQDVVLVAHEDCGAYKAERVPLVTTMLKRVTGKTVSDIQREHLAQAGRRITLGLRGGVRVRSFYAEVQGPAEDRRVRFVEVG